MDHVLHVVIKRCARSVRERYFYYLVLDNRKDTRSPTHGDAHRGADTVDGRDVHDHVASTRVGDRCTPDQGARSLASRNCNIPNKGVCEFCEKAHSQPIHTPSTGTEFVSSTDLYQGTVLNVPGRS